MTVARVNTETSTDGLISLSVIIAAYILAGDKVDVDLDLQLTGDHLCGQTVRYTSAN